MCHFCGCSQQVHPVWNSTPGTLPLQKEHIVHLHLLLRFQRLIIQQQMFLHQRERGVSWGYEKIHLPKITSHQAFQLESIVWRQAWDVKWVYLGGRLGPGWKGPSCKDVEQKPAWASQWGCPRPSGVGWIENLKTHISYFWIIFLQKAQPTPGHKSGPEHVPATVLTLQWKHNRFRESQPPHRIHQNNLRITDVQQHIQRLLGYLRIQFRSS